MAGGREGHALERSTFQFGQTVRGREAEILRAGVAVPAQPLARQVGQEEQAVAARPRFGGLGDDLLVADAVSMEGPPGPSHRVAARLEQHEGSPMAFDRGDVADFGVEKRLLGDDRQDAGGPGDVGGEARAANAGAVERHGIVGAADEDGRSGEQAGRRSGFGRDGAQDVEPVADRGQLARVEAERRRHGGGPGARGRVHQKGAGRVAAIHRDGAGEPQVDEVLRHQDMGGAFERGGIVVAQPGEFETRPGRRRRIAAQRQVVGGAMRGLVGGDEVGRPLVVPKRSIGTRRPAGLVDQHGPVHLAAGAEHRHAMDGVRYLVQHGADRLDHALPPAFDGLLGPAEGRDDLVLLRGRDGEDRTVERHQCGPDAARADVDREGEVLGAGHRRSHRAPY